MNGESVYLETKRKKKNCCQERLNEHYSVGEKKNGGERQPGVGHVTPCINHGDATEAIGWLLRSRFFGRVSSPLDCFFVFFIYLSFFF